MLVAGMKKVCIVGSAPNTAWMAAQMPPDVDIWASGGGFRWLPHIDRWFEIHADGKQNPDTAYPYWLKRFDGQLITPQTFPEEAIATVASHYLRSTVAYMLALAIHEGYSEVTIVGVDMDRPPWDEARPSLMHLMGLARGQGIKVEIPKEAGIGNAREATAPAYQAGVSRPHQ